MATSSPRTMPSRGPALLAEREAAEAAVTQAHERAAAVGDVDVTDEVLEHLRQLRAAVLGGLRSGTRPERATQAAPGSFRASGLPARRTGGARP